MYCPRSGLAPRIEVRVSRLTVSRKPSSRGIVEPESAVSPPKGLLSTVPLLEGFCFPAPSGRAANGPTRAAPRIEYAGMVQSLNRTAGRISKPRAYGKQSVASRSLQGAGIPLNPSMGLGGLRWNFRG